MLHGVIYARYSSEKQNEQSIEGQIRENKAFAVKNGIEIVGTYVDRALSAKSDKRPEFQRMIKDASKGGFDVVIVWKLDRFARNRYDSAKYKAALKKNNVKVISATEEIGDGSLGVLIESMLEGMAEYYSVDLAEKVTRGMTENALKCVYNGGNLPIGYVIDLERHYQLDPVTAPLVLQAFTDYDNGISMRKIVDNFNFAGVRTCRGGKVNLNCVTKMLHNRCYLGEYRFRDVVVPGGVPGIVPDELFDRVQEKMLIAKKNRSRFKADEEYLLTTKLFCGKCRSFMVGESGRGKMGEVYRYYKCISVKKHTGCDKKSVRKENIEDLAIKEIKRVLMDDELLEKIADTALELQSKENVVIPALQRQLVDVEKKIGNVLNAIERGIITDSTKDRLEALEAEKTELKAQITVEESNRPPLLTKDQILFWFERMRKLDTSKLEHKRRLIDAFINSIYLYDDRAVFVFNYKDGSETVTFEEVDESGLGSDCSCGRAPQTERAYLQVRSFCLSYVHRAGKIMRGACGDGHTAGEA